MDDCQKFANNYWISPQAELENVKAQKAKMISSLPKTLGRATRYGGTQALRSSLWLSCLVMATSA
jgi:hypothetical protein